MYPVICKIGSLTIYSYGLMLAIAFLAASVLAGKQAKREGFSSELVFNFSFAVFIAGIIGARIFYVVENIAYYFRHPLEIIMLQEGGLSWFGGLILAVAYALTYLKTRKISAYKMFDLISPFLALAQSLGRIGCLLNGCCYGKTVIPTQVYSSLSLLLIFIALRIVQQRPHKTGQVFFTYLLLYSIKRFLVEFWRTDNPVVFAHMTLFQIISIIIFVLAVFKLSTLKDARV